LVDGLFGFNFKAPVSGALFAVVAGLFDRATSTGAIRRPRVRRMCLPACLTAATAFFAVLAVRAFAATVLVSSARHDMARDAYRPAQQKLEHAEKLEPWNWRVSYLLAHAAVKMADGEGAADCFGRALRKNPNHIPSLIERGQMNVGTAAGGDLEEAENCARRALQLCKPLPEGLDLLGRVAFYRARGKAAGTERDRLLEETRRYCRDAMACGAGNRSTLHEIIGETHAAQGDFKAAEKSFGLAARNCPPDGNLWVSYQQLASMTDDYTGFADSLEAAIGIMERDARRYKRDLESARACLGRIHLESGRDEQALADFRAIVQADPASGYWRGYLEAAMRLNKLEQFFADMRKLNPGLLKSGPPEQQIVYTRHLLATVGPAAARAHIIEVLRTQKLDDEQRRALEAELATIPQTQ
jgi:tetratricopeptide (TPR) repeat protein